MGVADLLTAGPAHQAVMALLRLAATILALIAIRARPLPFRLAVEAALLTAVGVFLSWKARSP
jgi:hypothetical protein